MPYRYDDYLYFPFNGGRGIRTNQLDGDFLATAIVTGEQLLIGKGDGTYALFDGVPQRRSTSATIGARVGKNFAASDFSSVPTAMVATETLAVPQFTGTDKHIAIWWRAETPAIDTIRLYASAGGLLHGSHNYIDQFDKPVSLTLGGHGGFYIATTDPVAENRSGDILAAYSATGIPTFLHRAAIRPEADGNTFIASDFTGARGFSSTNEFVTIDEAQVDTSYYDAIATPSTMIPVSEIYSRGFGEDYNVPTINRYTIQPGGLNIGGTDHQILRSTPAWYDNDLQKTLRIEQVPKL